MQHPRTTTRRDFLRASGVALSSVSVLKLTGCSGPSGGAGSGVVAHDGVGLAEMVRAGLVTPRELVEDTLARIDQVNPELNAVLSAHFDPNIALERASGPLGGGALAGVPVLLKNMIEYDEARVDYGSRLMARAKGLGVLPKQPSSPFVEAMLGSGMIITGMTNAPEFGLIDTTEPVLHGPTRNPWNVAYSTGGSSGGAAAAVAAGIVPIAHANDGGGSIRIPAAHCGVFGLKPTRGRELGTGRVFGRGPLNIVSDLCISRSVRDTAAFLSVVERRGDPELPALGRIRRSASAGRLRIALVLNGLEGSTPHSEVARAVRRAADRCQALGHEVSEAALPIDGSKLSDAFVGLWATMALGDLELCRTLFGSDAGSGANGLLEAWTLGLAGIASERGPEECKAKATEAFVRASQRMQAFFQGYDVLLSPVESVPPFRLGYHDTMGDFETVFERVLNDCAYTPLNNATGMPGMSVPLHWTEDGLPVGVQFSAWRGGEPTLLQLAYELEEAHPWAHRMPPVAVT